MISSSEQGHSLIPVMPNTRASLQRSSTAASGEPRFSVAVLGAAGGIGQPLALLLKDHPAVGELRLYDVVGTAGVGADIGHINTQSKVSAPMLPDEMVNIQGSEIAQVLAEPRHVRTNHLMPHRSHWQLIRAVQRRQRYATLESSAVGVTRVHDTALATLDSAAPQVTAHTGAEELSGALYGADLVVIPAGVPRKPGMTRDDLFNTNAGRWTVFCI